MAGETVIVGLGRSGRAAAEIAVSAGEDVIGVDLDVGAQPIEGARLQLGPHDRRTFTEARRLILSPGVPATQPDVVAAVDAGVEVIGELGYAASLLEDLPMVAITGTNGKSTVTWFTGQLLEAAGFTPFVGGNLGNPLSNAALARSRGERPDVLVVEVSSYQLEWPGRLRPEVGVILNLTPDHLARHGDMEGYARAKSRLFERQGPRDLALLPSGDDRLLRHRTGDGALAWLGAHPGVARRDRAVHVLLPTVDARLDLDGFAILGSHNLDNAATAAALALAIGADPDAVAAALPGLEPLEHRMEVVGEVGGVTFINDSKATNVDAARVGISGVDRPAVVLLGGQAKGPGFDALAPLLARHRAVVCFGGSGPAIADELEAAGVQVVRASSMEDALEIGAARARPGDIVLLSPGCASFDAFDDFEHRGRVFRQLVHRRSPR